MYPHPASRQNTGVHTAHVAKAQAPVVLDGRDHQTDFIHMSKKRDTRSRALLMGDNVEQIVHRHLIHKGSELLREIFRHLHFLTAGADLRRRLGQNFLHIHG